MIDAQAVLAHLEKLGTLAPASQVADASPTLTWFRDELPSLPLQYRRDEAGNEWVTLPGSMARAVVLGTYREAAAAGDRFDSALGLVVGLETLKALAIKSNNLPPCTLQMVVWAESASHDRPFSVPLSEMVAYLELHMEPHTQLEAAGAPLGVVLAPSGDESAVFNARLMTLCDEAIRELTGSSASLPAGQNSNAMELARRGVPSAMMYVQALPDTPGAETLPATRLHLLQAAEAFGRWAESAVHLVAGEEVDLWAREQRVPHS